MKDKDTVRDMDKLLNIIKGKLETLTELCYKTSVCRSERQALAKSVSKEILALCNSNPISFLIASASKLALSKIVNKPDFNQYKLSEFITMVCHKLTDGKALKDKEE